MFWKLLHTIDFLKYALVICKFVRDKSLFLFVFEMVFYRMSLFLAPYETVMEDQSNIPELI